MDKKIFAKKIAEWYEDNKRNLPWRDTRDPYRIWLSEIILQQTRVAQGLPYYERFIGNFPTIESLAGAHEAAVLRLWQGLGYYSRARNLLRCARLITRDYSGRFPSTFDELTTLPGVGPYTAAAIASICFGQQVAVVDGNVHRVLSRVFGVHEDVASSVGKAAFFQLAQTIVPASSPDIFNQAVMEFGALHCLPQRPLCDSCIFAKACYANVNLVQGDLPVKSKGAKIRKRYFYYFVFERNKKWALNRREAKDIWNGLFDFYLVESNRPRRPEDVAYRDEFLRRIVHKKRFADVSGVYVHVLSHQKLFARFISIQLKPGVRDSFSNGGRGLRFYSSKQIAALPKPVLITRYLKDKSKIR